MREQSGMFAAITHDMRAPVGAISCIAQLLLSQAEDVQAVRRHAMQILNACDELEEMIGGALDLAAQGRIALLEAPCVPEMIMHSAQDTAGALARAKGQQLIVTLEGPCAQPVIGDAGRLRRILLNLLSNAVKYTPCGGEIDLSARAQADGARMKLTFSVRDNGMGMDAAMLEHLFDPYARAGDARRAGIEGTGIGLSVVHALVKAMGGTLEVSSRPAEGSLFVFAVELALAPQVHDVFCGRRFLLAEDNALAADVTAELLRERGAQVTVARDGEQAVACFAASEVGSFEAVFMDVMMPGMGGCQAARAIRAMDRPDAAGVPIIAMTGAATPEIELQTRESGMNARAVKPVRMDALAQMLAKLGVASP